MVATADVGRVAAEALLDPPSGVRIVELAGPRDVTPEDVAATVSRKLGREVKLLPLPAEAAGPALEQAGFSPGIARLFAEMYGAVNSGHMGWEGGAVVSKRGRLGPDDVAILTYTSGTTGPSKGAMNTHGNVVFSSTVYQTWMRLGDGDVIAGLAPLFHITGLISHLTASILAGIPLVLFYRFDPAEALRMIERWKATFTVASITAFISSSDICCGR